MKDALTHLYLAILGRAPDPDGLAYWQARLDEGRSVAEVSSLMMASPEAEMRFVDTHEPEAVVAAYYQQLFGRQPDAEGLAYWLGEVDAGHLTLASLPAYLPAGARANPDSAGDVSVMQARTAAASDYLALLDAGWGVFDLDHAGRLMAELTRESVLNPPLEPAPEPGPQPPSPPPAPSFFLAENADGSLSPAGTATGPISVAVSLQPELSLSLSREGISRQWQPLDIQSEGPDTQKPLRLDGESVSWNLSGTALKAFLVMFAGDDPEDLNDQGIQALVELLIISGLVPEEIVMEWVKEQDEKLIGWPQLRELAEAQGVIESEPTDMAAYEALLETIVEAVVPRDLDESGEQWGLLDVLVGEVFAWTEEHMALFVGQGDLMLEPAIQMRPLPDGGDITLHYRMLGDTGDAFTIHGQVPEFKPGLLAALSQAQALFFRDPLDLAQLALLHESGLADKASYAIRDDSTALVEALAKEDAGLLAAINGAAELTIDDLQDTLEADFSAIAVEPFALQMMLGETSQTLAAKLPPDAALSVEGEGELVFTDATPWDALQISLGSEVEVVLDEGVRLAVNQNLGARAEGQGSLVYWLDDEAGSTFQATEQVRLTEFVFTDDSPRHDLLIDDFAAGGFAIAPDEGAPAGSHRLDVSPLLGDALTFAAFETMADYASALQGLEAGAAGPDIVAFTHTGYSTAASSLESNAASTMANWFFRDHQAGSEGDSKLFLVYDSQHTHVRDVALWLWTDGQAGQSQGSGSGEVVSNGQVDTGELTYLGRLANDAWTVAGTSGSELDGEHSGLAEFSAEANLVGVNDFLAGGDFEPA